MTSLKKYEYVIAIANHGGISGAAEALDIAQPALSKYLKKIEEDVGCELFDRTSIPIKPTKCGEAFIATGKAMIDAERQLKKQIGEIKENEGAAIRIGISPSRAIYMMPKILTEYRKKIPSGKIIIEEYKTAELCEKLSCGELDIIISLHGDDTKEFYEIELFKESLLLALPKGYDIESIKSYADTLPLISVGRGQALFPITASFARQLGIPDVKIEAQSIESALMLVRYGLGATIVPSYVESFGGERNSAIKFIPLDELCAEGCGADYCREVCLFYRKSQFLTLSERTFIECAKELNGIF